MNIKAVDLTRENDLVKKSCLKQISLLADSSQFTLGAAVAGFEKRFARFCGATFCVGVGSGTDALRTALLACGIGRGDEVVTTPTTYTSTSLAIAHCGAIPVFVDVLSDGNIDPTKVEAAITRKTKAILVVHMYGNICDMNSVRVVAKRHRLFLIDDCAHAHGASYQGKKAGSIADISCFSFYPTKNLGAWGDAGAITTSNARLFERALLFKNYGEEVQNYSKVIGYNSKLDTIQAIVLDEKLKHLKQWNRQRSRVAQTYTRTLRGVGDVETLPFSRYNSYYNFPIITKHRDKLAAFLSKKGIETPIRYPLPIHLQKCFAYLGYAKGDFPRAEKFAASVMSLPMHSHLTKKDQAFIIRSVRSFFHRKI